MTLASDVRAKAVECSYWAMSWTDGDRRWFRKDIARALGCPTARVTETLKRVGRVGRPRKEFLPRCEHCGQAIRRVTCKGCGAPDSCKCVCAPR